MSLKNKPNRTPTEGEVRQRFKGSTLKHTYWHLTYLAYLIVTGPCNPSIIQETLRYDP